MGCFKFDKLDKIVISFTFIIVTFFCLFNTFSNASENVEFNTYYNIIADLNSGKFINSNNQSCVSFLAEKGYKYTIRVVEGFSSYDRFVVSASDKPTPGLSFDVLFSSLLNTGDYFTYTPNEDIYLTITPNVKTSSIVVEREVLTGLDETITKLTSNVGINNVWSIFDKSIPYVLVVVLFSLGVWFIKHNIIEHSKGRDF